MNAFLLAASSEFKPQEEFDLPAWVPIHLGPLDMSINKAVVYLWVGAAVTILIGIWIMRFGLSLRPTRRQTTGEAIYELIQGQMVEGSLPSRAIGTWFPYVASLFLFIWILNIVGFIPLPISNDHFHLAGLELPTWGIYAATANLSVTLALALVTFFATHEEGIRHNGFRRYFGSWIPSGLPPFNAKTAILWGLIVFLEYVSQFMRLVSLSVRLFANMLAGHMLILVMIGLIFIWVINMVGFIPLPLSDEKFHLGGLAIPTFGIYAATASLSVTLALSLMTWVFTHIEGVRFNGLIGYVKSLIPEVPKAIIGFISIIEFISVFMRLISLSVRLFANMLAGHMLILVMIGLIFVIHTPPWRFLGLPAAVLFYIFEVVIVVSIQAFIFAALSAIYIGSAIEPEH